MTHGRSVLFFGPDFFAVVSLEPLKFGRRLFFLMLSVLVLAPFKALANRLANGAQPLPHLAVGIGPRDFDQIMVVVLKRHLPELLGPAGLLLGTLIIIAIMAAAMSTADSNLHAMSAVLTRDIYGGVLRPGASEKSRLWVGPRGIAPATVL